LFINQKNYKKPSGEKNKTKSLKNDTRIIPLLSSRHKKHKKNVYIDFIFLTLELSHDIFSCL
jgi:hypothetical protein